jgi:hypothetical protein
MPSGLFQSMGAMTAFHDVFNAALAPPGFSALCCVPAAWFAAQISATTPVDARKENFTSSARR